MIARHVLIALCLGAGASSAAALTLGAARGGVVLGRPVDVAIEVTPDPGKTLDDSCITADVVAGERPLTRVRVLPLPDVAGRSPAVRVLTAQAADEPVLSLTLSAGCTGKTTRTYTFLADPPAIALPSLATAPTQASAVLPGRGTGAPANAAALAAQARPRAAGRQEAGNSLRSEAMLGAPTVAPSSPKAAKPAKPAQRSVVQRPAPTPAPAPARSRLVMEPLEDWLGPIDEAPPTLRLSAEMPAQLEAATAERRAQLLAQWKALNMGPQEVLQESQRQAAQEQALALARGQAEQERRLAQDLRQEVHERFSATVVYALALLVLLALGLAAWMLWRARQIAEQARLGWEAAVAGQEPAPPAAPANADLVDAAPATVPMPMPAPQFPAYYAGATPVAVPMSEHITPSDSVLGELTGMAPNPASPVLTPEPPSAIAQPPAQSPVAAPASGLQVDPEAFFDLQQQADFYVSVGEHDQAIAVLKKFIAANETTAPTAYLDLLRLYRSLSRVEGFNQLRSQFHAHFNAQVPEFAAFTRAGQTLFAYADELAQIEAVWTDESVLPLLEGLLFRHGEEPHERFELQAYDDLLLLYAIARTTPASARGAPPPRARTTPEVAPPAHAQAAQQPGVGGDFEDSLLEFDSAWLQEPPTKSDPLTAPPPAQGFVPSDMGIDFVMTNPGALGDEPLPHVTLSDLPAVAPTAPPQAGQVVGFGATNDLYEARLDPEVRKP